MLLKGYLIVEQVAKQLGLFDVGNKQSDTKNNNGGSVGKKFKIQFLPKIIFYKPS